MPITTIMPTVAADPTKSIVGQHCVFSVLPTAGSQTNYKGKIAAFSRSTERLERRVASAGGVLTRDRSVLTGVTNQFRVTIDDFTSDLATTFLNASQVVGTAKLWIKDPDDAANTAALITNEFSATCYVDGEVSFQQDQFSEVTIVVDVTGTLTFSLDGATNV